MKKFLKFFLPLIVLALFFPAAIFAYEAKTGVSIYVPANETIEGNYYAAGQNITIDGNINGDIICAAQSIQVNGSVDGDIICAGQSIIINGPVKGDIRLAGNTITVNSQIEKNANLFGAVVITGEKTTIGRDLFLGAAVADISGQIAGNLHGGVSGIKIKGSVAKDVKLRVDHNSNNQKFLENEGGLTVGDEAVIGGHLYYKAVEQGQVDSGAEIKGDTGFTKLDKKTRSGGYSAWLWGLIYAIFSEIIVGLVLITFFRKHIQEIINSILANRGGAIGRGAIIMFATPFIIFLIAITFIGIPLALVLGALWLISFLAASIITSIIIGSYAINKLSSKKEEDGALKELGAKSLTWAMIIGIIIFKTVSTIPLFGWLFGLVGLWLGLGGLWFFLKPKN
jgi:hypothetical protein